MVDIRHQGRCAAPVEVAFDYIDNYRNATSWMFGLSELHPRGERDHGLGAIFDGTFAVRPIRLSSTVEVTDWRRHELVAFTSIKGFANRSTWRFAADGPERTVIDVIFTYDLPGGLAGRALGRALEPIVALSVRRSDAALRKHIETAYAGRGR